MTLEIEIKAFIDRLIHESKHTQFSIIASEKRSVAKRLTDILNGIKPIRCNRCYGSDLSCICNTCLTNQNELKNI